jgi:hypothetical protein
MTEKILQLNTEKNIFWTLVGILFFCLCFYMYSINVTVRNVVARQDLQNKISTLTLSVGNSEFQYISAQDSVTLQLAYSLGFKDVADKVYISKTTGSLAYNVPVEVARY